MQSLLLLPLLVLGVRAGPFYSEVYSGSNQTGDFVTFSTFNYSHDLSHYNLDDDIESVRQTGMWMYYENYDFSIKVPGTVYYVHGIDVAATFPAEYQNTVSSLRCASCSGALNEDTITLYEGQAFAGWGATFRGNGSFFAGLNPGGNVSSILVSGTSPWTVYTNRNHTGSSWCLQATDHDVSSNGTTLDLGIFPFVEEIGIPDNSIWSVSKGCSTARVTEAPKLQVDGRQENGAWGRLVQPRPCCRGSTQ